MRDKGYIGDTEHQILTVLTDARKRRGPPRLVSD